MAVGSLRGALGQTEDTPDWEPTAIRLEQALLQGDAAGARALLPRFLEQFRQEPLLFVPLAEGGEPRQILRARLAQTMLHALVVTLPQIGLLRDTYQLLRAARDMEQPRPGAPAGMTQFNHLFEAGYQGVVECLVVSAEQWSEDHGDDPGLVAALDAVTRPFVALWAEHVRTVRLSALETVPSEDEWQEVRDFVRRYGSDLFHARFMSLANLRGILHQGVGAFLDHLAANPDPLHPVRLIDDLEGGLPREPVERRLRLVLEAVVENYDEYRDYNTTTGQSDYGENLHLLLDFLRLKAGYDRHAWHFRPFVLAHEVLARGGRAGAAVLWEGSFAQATHAYAGGFLAELARLEQAHGTRLASVAGRLHERFVKPLAVDRLCALVEPAMEEARLAESAESFVLLEQELRPFVAEPAGVGLEVPIWLRRLAEEVARVRATRGAVAVLAQDIFRVPDRTLAWEELQRQIQEWDNPPDGGAEPPGSEEPTGP
jgi:hypothetical protein